jgi:hypothetical protein
VKRRRCVGKGALRAELTIARMDVERMVGTPAALPTRHHSSRLVPQLRLHDGLADLGAAVGAFIGEVDLRHGPMRLDVTHIHFKSDATRTDDEAGLDFVVMMDVGWHVGSPQEDTQESIHQWSLTGAEHTPAARRRS